MITRKMYEEQISMLARKARAWYDEHPDRVAVVNWRWPRHVTVTGTWSQAREVGLVELNDVGEDLVAAMLRDHPASLEPTPLMMRVALELAKEDP